MKRHKWILIFLLLGFLACNDDDVEFIVSPNGLEIDFKPVAGGAMMYYSLPRNGEIFAMNVRYTNSQGKSVLKACGYGGDSILLDGFTRKVSDVSARISFVNKNNKESGEFEYKFNTLNSAPWDFFEGLQVEAYWGGFKVNYTAPEVVTGIAHVFYLGTNMTTKQEDTLLVQSFPINRGVNTMSFKPQQEKKAHTVIIRTEDFQGYRVRQEIYPNIDAYLTEKWPMTPDDFNDFGLSQENEAAKSGVKYLFDGELRGRERLIDSKDENPMSRPYTAVVCTYLAGPMSFNKPIVLDLKEEKVPGWVRLYCMQPINAQFTSNAANPLGKMWRGFYIDKLPCKLTVYGSKQEDPYSDAWVKLGELDQKPESIQNKESWAFRNWQLGEAVLPEKIEEFEQFDPISVDIEFAAGKETYRYLKIVVEDTFRRPGELSLETNYNTEQYFTLHELEVYVKKD